MYIFPLTTTAFPLCLNKIVFNYAPCRYLNIRSRRQRIPPKHNYSKAKRNAQQQNMLTNSRKLKLFFGSISAGLESNEFPFYIYFVTNLGNKFLKLESLTMRHQLQDISLAFEGQTKWSETKVAMHQLFFKETKNLLHDSNGQRSKKEAKALI